MDFSNVMVIGLIGALLGAVATAGMHWFKRGYVVMLERLDDKGKVIDKGYLFNYDITNRDAITTRVLDESMVFDSRRDAVNFRDMLEQGGRVVGEVLSV